MKTKRVIRWSLECLFEGDKTTDEIREFINEKSNHGTTGHGLANILGKDWRFQKVGEIYTDKGLGKYKVTVWALSDVFKTALLATGSIPKKKDFLMIMKPSIVFAGSGVANVKDMQRYLPEL